MNPRQAISRREFLKASTVAGSGLLISIYLPGCAGSPTPATEPALEPTETPEPGFVLEPNAFLRIDSRGGVTIILHKCELGQGVGTTLPMIVAEELDADWQEIAVEQVEARDIQGKTRTSGSDSTQDLYTPLRRAGAMARALLVAAAAQNWGVEPSSCSTENSSVIHQSTGQRLTYSELVEAAAEIGDTDYELKDPRDFGLVGTPAARLGLQQIVDGSGVYGTDVRLPNMLYASIEPCPVFGGSVAELNSTETQQVAGIRSIVQLRDGVAVVAETTWAALEGRRRLQITWDEGSDADLNTDSMRSNFTERLPLGDEEGVLEAIYEVPFLAHVTPEPMNCTADVREDGCDIWAPTQNPGDTLMRASMITGLSRNEINVHIPLIGGGFGRRLQVDYVEQAVTISRQIGEPVQVIWTREDDVKHDYYHPFTLHRTTAVLDPPSWPRIRTISSEGLIPTGPWRAATNVAPAFVRECFVDEMAEHLGQDPYELRMEMSDYRDLWGVLETVATAADWNSALPTGWGRGIAAHSTWNISPTAHVVEVSVDGQGNVRVHRVVCAIDCGLVINPDIVKAQMEGGIVFGLTAALKGEITVENGRVRQSNFHDYPIMRFDEMPVVEVHILPSERDPSGAVERAVPPIIPAVVNAVFAATGKRIRKLPVRPEELRQA